MVWAPEPPYPYHNIPGCLHRLSYRVFQYYTPGTYIFFQADSLFVTSKMHLLLLQLHWLTTAAKLPFATTGYNKL